MILLQKEILTIILDFFGPDIIAVHILTSAVQIYRDHEETVRELWWCGRAATEWLSDRRIERITREIERKERTRGRAILARELWRRRYWRDMSTLNRRRAHRRRPRPTKARTSGTAYLGEVAGHAGRGAQG